jgi:hypothetical protein
MTVLGEHHQERLPVHPAGDVCQHSRRRVVEPMRVVDEDHTPAATRDAGQQVERGEADDRDLRPGFAGQADGGGERAAVGRRQRRTVVEQGGAQQVQPAYGRSRSAATPLIRSSRIAHCLFSRVVLSGGLADAVLPDDAQHPGTPG